MIAHRYQQTALWKAFRAVAGHPQASIVTVVVLGFCTSALVALFKGLPVPLIMDEFSLLLAADTYAHGRLTNPTHPFWHFFETFYLYFEPTYMSKYQPAPGLMLAAGKLLLGHPAGGLWLGMAFMGGCIVWMLRAWVPPIWAFLGGIIAILHPGVGAISYWTQSYWGCGFVSAAGGALVFGALPRFKARPSLAVSLPFALGLIILANSRPYEGFLFSIPSLIYAAVVLHCQWKKSAPEERQLMRRMIFYPFFFSILAAGVAMGYYNNRLTGSPWTLPYMHYNELYPIAPNFIWETPHYDKYYRHNVFSEFVNTTSRDKYEAMSGSVIKVLTFIFYDHIWASVQSYAPSLFRMGLIFALILMLFGNSQIRIVFLTLVFLYIGICLNTWYFPHYDSPLTGLYFILFMKGFYLLSQMRLKNRPWGKVAVVVTLLIFLPLYTSALALRQVYTKKRPPGEQFAKLRDQLITTLEQTTDDNHLIFVRYGKEHVIHYEWIYNEADIDRARVVWARDLDANENQKLIAYFPDRKVWLLREGFDDAPHLQRASLGATIAAYPTPSSPMDSRAEALERFLSVYPQTSKTSSHSR